MNFFFTESTLGSKSTTYYVGEVTYVDRRIPNFLGLSYLGSVNVHKDKLKSVLAFAAAAYGALHIAAWNDYFPTRVERILWITCSVTIGSSGIFFWLLFWARQTVEKIDVIADQISRSNKLLTIVGRYILAPIFILARVYLVVEAFVSLRRMPIEVYKTPEWSNYFPHL
jgi:hypothetical protein